MFIIKSTNIYDASVNYNHNTKIIILETYVINVFIQTILGKTSKYIEKIALSDLALMMSIIDSMVITKMID